MGIVVLFLSGRWSLCDRECKSLCMKVIKLCVGVYHKQCGRPEHNGLLIRLFLPVHAFTSLLVHFKHAHFLVFFVFPVVSVVLKFFLSVSLFYHPSSFFVCLFVSFFSLLNFSFFFCVLLSVSISSLISSLGYEPKNLSEIRLRKEKNHAAKC